MVKTIINEKEIDKSDVVLVSAAYEKTASSHKGTARGPKEVVNCLHSQIEFYDRKFGVEVIDFVKTAHKDLGNLDKFSPEEVLEKMKSTGDELVKKDKFVFLLGGEHSVSVGIFHALAKKYNPKDVTILQIDAHCDLRKDDSDYTENISTLAHSTVMRHASSLGYPIVQVGVRSFSTEEFKYFSNKKNKVTAWQWGLGKVPSITQVLKSIKTKYLYITIDVDGFDPSVMPGTGTPVPDGLTWAYGVELIEKAISKYELIGADVVEVSPVSDSVLTEYSSAQLVYTIIANKFKNRFTKKAKR